MIYDAHCHLDLLGDMKSAADSANQYGLNIFAVVTTPKAYLRECQFCSEAQGVSVGLGMHPQLIGGPYEDMNLFRNLCRKARYIGEVGLDFGKEYIKSKETQIIAFDEIIGLCEKYGNKVVSIHSLKSSNTVLDILKKNGIGNTYKNAYILHWFTGTSAQLRRAIELDCYFSINPRMTRTLSGKKVIESLPLERILVESDAPFGVRTQDITVIKKELEDAISCISLIRERNVSDIIGENSQRLFE